MTREEAIEILKQFKKCLSDVVFDEKGSEAWQMAISALEQEPCEPCRNKAYEYGIGRTTWVHLDNKNGTVTLPRSDFEEILQVISRYEQKPCEDAISREAVLDQLDQSINILEATDRIKALPHCSADMRGGINGDISGRG